ncbi:quinoprotein dehydrogenase-associated SoxYZ-like carrier [Paracoccus aestuarii]|uniref:Quinoprotein dehydrogenase-associated SoxYZ-like carrier n=1 Tax=Paracoccus aestuarii TaxID=453842 RepID=A0A418ZZ46_9RHOB|nr:quinoprotein dehydrogenase-associated SoxYZ-like carrier [Paracoccus aestuarii]RJL05751.1 quinoprotein dehydrogenase-associated SoxYZ-like carrier [Paracoccus aestuarii]WCQ99201.1 quinoprotein dehydrogenase-associated SoxYZ-like carrier [Paracoccus aestuarii]
MRPWTILAAALLAGPAFAQDNPLQPSPTWEDLRISVLGVDEEPPLDAAVLDLDAPPRAHDAATVPVHLTQPADAPPLTALTLVVDENPAPVAAEYAFGPALMPLDFEVRVRVDSYSDLRAIATTQDGAQVMAGRFVKAAGGCSAPAGKDMAAVRATMGQMRWRSAQEDGRHVGTLMIRHPNFSGLQRDQLTLLSIPAHFIDRLDVRQGDEVLFTMSAGISVSEDPVFRFAYRPDGQDIHVRVEDTNGNVWTETFDPVASSAS